MKKIYLLIVIAFLIMPAVLRADGGMIPYEPVSLYETNQTALVFFENGNEDLYLDVAFIGETDKFSWVIPTPSLPKAELASDQLFSDLDMLTRGSQVKTSAPSIPTTGSTYDSISGVNVYSSQQLGLYNINIVSASGVDGLYSWFVKNGYNISADNKSILQGYIDKSWYFVVVKIDKEELLRITIDKFKKIDSSVTELTFADKLTDYIIGALKLKEYSKVRNIFVEMSDFAKMGLNDLQFSKIVNSTDEAMEKYLNDYDDYGNDETTKWDQLEIELKARILNITYDLKSSLKLDLTINEFKKIDSSVTADNLSQKFAELYVDVVTTENYEKYLKMVSVMSYIFPEYTFDMTLSKEDYLEEVGDMEIEESDYAEAISEIKEAIDDEFVVDGENALYRGALSPLKISFKTIKPIYPLKISQLSSYSKDDTGKLPNKLMLYTISAVRYSAPMLTESFAKNIDRFYLESRESNYVKYTDLKNIVTEKKYWLSKFTADLYKEDMDSDISLPEYIAPEWISGPVKLYFFYNDSFSSLPSLAGELNRLKADYSGLEVIGVKLDGMKATTSLKEKFNLSISNRNYTGYIIIGDKQIGYSGSGSNTDQAVNTVEITLKDCLENGCEDVLAGYGFTNSLDLAAVMKPVIVPEPGTTEKTTTTCVDGTCSSSLNRVTDSRVDAKNLSLRNREYFEKKLKIKSDPNQEKENYDKYLKSFVDTNYRSLDVAKQESLNIFVSYGVDENTKLLGAGERAAVIKSFYQAFGRFPESEDDFEDLVLIANGRWPNKKDASAEKKARMQFEKIYKRIADMNDKKDEAAITVMAYGLRQKASNRNLSSEAQGIKTFKSIYGHNPATTEEWNIMQAITYSGAARGIDTDGDLLTDDRELKFGTDPRNADSDGDGYKDGEEVSNGYSPKGSGKLI